MKVVSTSIICTFILFITCIQTSIGANSMDECTLFVGGDFISSSNTANSTEISTSFLKYDLGSETFSSSYGPGVYSNSYMNNLFYFNNNLFFAGDITRVQFENSVNLGSYDFNSKALKGANQGIWTQSNILPTLDSSYSPSLLFAAYGTSTNLIIAGRFDSHEEIQKIALYDTVSKVYSQFPLSGVDWTSKTVISLLSTSTSVFIATMNEADLTTNLYVFMDDIWSPISSPTYTTAGSTEELKIMFDSLTISGESLFTVAYQSSNSLLSAPSVSFYLVSWSLQDLTAEPAVIMVYQKTCSASSSSSTTDSGYTTNNNNIVYPKIVPYRNQTILVALPTGSCPVSASDVRFAIYSDTLTLKTDELGGIATLSHFKTPRHFVTNSNYDLFLSNGDALYGMKNSGSNGAWSSILKTDNTPIVSVTWSDAHQELYLGYVSQGVVHVDHCTISSKTTRWSLFSDGIYTAGKINTVVELANSNILIGGDFQYVGAAFVSARFAALWNGATWVPTLKGNALPGAKLLAAQALGNVVYAFANPGDTVVGNLPVMHWTADSGWTYLPTRPTLYSFDNTTAPIWDRTAATVYIDHTNRTVYFGGNFTVRYDAKQPVASGVIIYNIAKERWSTLPANLTNVHAVGSLSSHSLLQIGGKFTFVDKYAIAVTYENYVLYDPIAQRFLPDVPVSPATEVFAVAPFPGQSKYSFVGGNFGTQGVEQLRNVANVWSWSVVGNSPLSATVYSLTSRNEGTVLFAGGSFANGLAKFDIPTLVWSSLIPAEFSWKGTVKSVTLHCPFDDLYYSDKSDWDNTSHLEGLTSNDYHHNEQQPLTGWKIFGLVVAVLVTVSIVGAIGFYAFKMYKSHSAAAPVEYI